MGPGQAMRGVAAAVTATAVEAVKIAAALTAGHQQSA